MHRNSHTPDYQLVQQAISGRTEAFATLVDRYLAVVTGLAYAQVGNRTDAEDAAQETFLQAFRTLDALRDDRKFLPWIAGIARNVCNNLLRAKKREANALQDAPLNQETTEPDPSTTELHAVVRIHLRRLDPPDQEVLILHYFAGQSTREIAAVLQISRHAAKKRLERARARLANHLLDAIGQALEPNTPVQDRRARIIAAVATCNPPWQSTSSMAKKPAPAFRRQRLWKTGVPAIAAAVIVPLAYVYLSANPMYSSKTSPAMTEAPSAQSRLSSNNPVSATSNAAITHQNPVDAPQQSSVRSTEPPVQSPVTVTGQVVMAATGRPVPGVELILSPTLRKAVSDEAGRFTFDRSLSPGQHWITVKIVNRGSYVPTDGPVPFVVTSNQSTPGLIVPVTQAGVIEGLVTMNGQALSRQPVWVHYLDAPQHNNDSAVAHFGVHHNPADHNLLNDNAPGGQQTKRTDANGRFRFDGLIEGEVTVGARIDLKREPGGNRLQISESAKVETGATTPVHLDFRPVLSTLTGRLILDENAIPHAGVGTKPAETGQDDSELYFCDVDEHGRYVLEGVPAGNLLVWAYIRESDETEHMQRYALVKTTPLQSTELDFDFFSEPQVVGFVSNIEYGESATAISIEGTPGLENFTPQSPNDLQNLNPCAQATVQPNGTFHLQCQNPGNHTVFVFTQSTTASPNSRWAIATTWITGTSDACVTISLE